MGETKHQRCKSQSDSIVKKSSFYQLNFSILCFGFSNKDSAVRKGNKENTMKEEVVIFLSVALLLTAMQVSVHSKLDATVV